MEKRIYTEEPEEELWRLLLQYSYNANIRKYFIQQNNEKITVSDSFNDISNSISGAILQACEYYKASKIVNLQVRPLLLYYGATDLLYALTILTTGAIPRINNHGMRIETGRDNGYIAETMIRFNNQREGGVHCFARVLGTTTDLCMLQNYTLKMFLDSIAEICDDYESCYNEPSRILLLNGINTPDGRIEVINGNQQTVLSFLSSVEGFSTSYLKPQTIDNHTDDPYILLRRKINSKSITKTTYAGQPYLQVAHMTSNKTVTLPNTLNMYISLFALSTLCRYYPNVWNQFVTQDDSGEKGLIEKLMYYSRRMIPNVVLNHILGYDILLVSDRYVPEDRVHLVNEHEVKEMVDVEIQKQLRKEQVRNVLSNKK